MSEKKTMGEIDYLLDQMNRKEVSQKIEPCEIIWEKHGQFKKAFCKTHNQHLLYAYCDNKGQIVFVCQVAEDNGDLVNNTKRLKECFKLE